MDRVLLLLLLFKIKLLGFYIFDNRWFVQRGVCFEAQRDKENKNDKPCTHLAGAEGRHAIMLAYLLAYLILIKNDRKKK